MRLLLHKTIKRQKPAERKVNADKHKRVAPKYKKKYKKKERKKWVEIMYKCPCSGATWLALAAIKFRANLADIDQGVAGKLEKPKATTSHPCRMFGQWGKGWRMRKNHWIYGFDFIDYMLHQRFIEAHQTWMRQRKVLCQMRDDSSNSWLNAWLKLDVIDNIYPKSCTFLVYNYSVTAIDYVWPSNQSH